MTAYEIIRHIAGTGQLYGAVLAHIHAVFGHRGHGFGAWWVRTEWHKHPVNLARVILRMRRQFCQGGMGRTPAHPHLHWMWECQSPGQ